MIRSGVDIRPVFAPIHHTPAWLEMTHKYTSLVQAYGMPVAYARIGPQLVYIVHSDVRPITPDRGDTSPT